jgi:hypothetical protein
VSLAVKNLLTGELRLVPVGSTAIITPTELHILAGLVEAGTGAAKIGTITKVALGIGAVLATAGGLGLASMGDDGDSSGNSQSFSGTWVWSQDDDRETLYLQQSGDSLTGTYRFEYQETPTCAISKQAGLAGHVTNGIADISFGTTRYTTCDGYDATYSPGNYTCELMADGETYLYCNAWMPFAKQ